MLFTRDDLLRLLRGLNPWWGGRVPAVPRFRRPMYADCLRHATQGPERTVRIVTGARGAGKTTMLLQIAADLVAQGGDPRRVLYLDLGHPMLSGVPLPQIVGLYGDIVYRRDRPAVLLLDEVTCAREPDAEVESLVRGRTGDRIVATGSLRPSGRGETAGTQRVRWDASPAPSPSYGEFLAMRGLDPLRGADATGFSPAGEIDEAALRDLAGSLRPLRAEFRSYLVSGSLSRSANRSLETDAGGVFAEDRIGDCLRHDAALRIGPRGAEELRKLLAFLCLRSGDVFPVHRYARSSGMAAPTVASHLGVLEQCFLVRRVAPLARDGCAATKPRYAVFAGDSALRSEQLMRDERSLDDAEELRRVAATSLLGHLAESEAGAGAEIRYRRDPRCDGPLDLIAGPAGRRTLYRFASRHGPGVPDAIPGACRREGVTRAVLVTTESDEVAVSRDSDGVAQFAVIPAHVLAYALGRAEIPDPVRVGRESEERVPVLV